MKKLPEGVIIGANANAILGGLRLWDPALTPPHPLLRRPAASKRKSS